MEKNHDQKKSNCEIDKLPYEIIFNILSKLPIKFVFQCSSVSKSWHSIIRDPQFASVHLAQSAATDSNTILWCEADFPPNQIYLADYNTFKISNEITWISEACRDNGIRWSRLIGSCHGLICLSQPSEFVSVYVCNPLIKEYMVLPQSTHSTYRPALGFGFATKTREYKVVRMIPEVGVRRSYVEVYTLGTGYWRSKETIPYRLDFSSHWNMFLNGALHWVSHVYTTVLLDKFIVSFDLGDEEFRVIRLPELINGDSGRIWDVGVIRECLTVHFGSSQGCVEIWMMKDYGVKESWSKYFVFPEEPTFRVLDVPGNGKPILALINGQLGTYDWGSQKFTSLQFHGFADLNQVSPLVASLLTLESACGGAKMSRKGKIIRVMDTSPELKKNNGAHVIWKKEMDDIAI